MGYQEELVRLQEAKASMRQSIINKGVDAPEDAKIEEYPGYIAQIVATPKLTDWGVLYTTDYPQGIELTETDWAALCAAGNPLNLSVGGISKDTITKFEFGSKPTSIGNYFLYVCTNLAELSPIPNTITSIGNAFLGGCTSFNQPISIPASVTSISYSFLSYCKNFNSQVTIPNTAISIGQGFLKGCTNFSQPLTIPQNVTKVDNEFLQDCNNFVGPLTVECPSSVVYPTATLCTSSSAAPMYVTGVTLLGSQASAWKAKLPDSRSPFYRKLLLG